MAASTQAQSSAVVASQQQQQQKDFSYPWRYAFPPFFSLQPVAMSRSSQLASWSELITDYCRHHGIFSLSLPDALNSPLFHNQQLGRKLGLRDANAILSWMASPEGGSRAEYVSSPGKKGGRAEGGEDSEGGSVWIYWRRPEEWAVVLEAWVEGTGQKGSVLTLYEIVQGDGARKEDFFGMDMELLQKSLGICVKKGKAQVFGAEGSEGVKFF